MNKVDVNRAYTRDDQGRVQWSEPPGRTACIMLQRMLSSC